MPASNEKEGLNCLLGMALSNKVFGCNKKLGVILCLVRNCHQVGKTIGRWVGLYNYLLTTIWLRAHKHLSQGSCFLWDVPSEKCNNMFMSTLFVNYGNFAVFSCWYMNFIWES
jgi:hypothetical protein